MPWFLVVCFPGLLMCAALGLGHIESRLCPGADDDVLSPARMAEFVRKAVEKTRAACAVPPPALAPRPLAERLDDANSGVLPCTAAPPEWPIESFADVEFTGRAQWRNLPNPQFQQPQQPNPV